MFIRMTQTLATVEETYYGGEVYEIVEAQGQHWIRRGLAEATTTPPKHVTQFLDRLNVGEGKKCLFLPFVGEFGHFCMTHLPTVYHHKAGYKIVACRDGEQSYFPAADEFCTDWKDPYHDRQRVGTMRGQPLTWPDLCARYPDAQPIPAGGLAAIKAARKPPAR